ncbi:tripartite tricarboxylate transporter TctB family protein [Pelagibius sp.]|uniref:tripartite tricarboxylate transporter TctB family protein n=1 Tax=Pelagibius sp. TaxID=1931238 RepID=UPI003B510CBA
MTVTRWNSAVVVGAVLTAFGALALIGSFGINPDPDGGWGARIFPLAGSASLLVLGLLEVMKGLTAGETAPPPATPQLSAVFALLLLSLAYVWLMAKLGYLISTALAAPLALWLFGVRNLFALLTAALLCPLLYHLVFFVGLGVFPPLGAWFDLLDVIGGP